MQLIENLRTALPNGVMAYNNHISRLAHRHIRRPGLALCGLFVIGLLQAAFAQDASVYTTVDEEVVTETTGTDEDGNAFTRTTTTTANRKSPETIAAENRKDAWKNDPNASKFPYDSTGGAHRNDLDTARKGFDDPRNPWDGRYSNDNPANHPAGSAYDRGEPVNNYRPSKYRPGAFGTSGAGGGDDD